MAESRREEILMTALSLAAEKGLGNVSMQMIAEKVGIRKPSLYHHFASKEELLEALYAYLRERAKAQTHTEMPDYAVLFAGKTAREVLRTVAHGYRTMNSGAEIRAFYKVIFSERCYHSMAAKIIAEETQRMIRATAQLFYAMEVHHLLHFRDADMSAVSFALTLHGLMERAQDLAMANGTTPDGGDAMTESYLTWFCVENAVKE